MVSDKSIVTRSVGLYAVSGMFSRVLTECLAFHMGCDVFGVGDGSILRTDTDEHQFRAPSALPIVMHCVSGTIAHNFSLPQIALTLLPIPPTFCIPSQEEKIQA